MFVVNIAQSINSSDLKTMPQTILDAIAGDTRPAPPAAAPGGLVYHSYAEYSANRGRLNEEYRPAGSTIVNGTLCTIRRDRSEVVAAWAPPLNAQCLPNYQQGVWQNARDFVPDHSFVRREPRPDDGTGPSPIKKAYAMCQGCFDRGWHREETDVSALAFGLDPTTLPEYPPPRTEGGDMTSCLKQPPPGTGS